MISINPDSKNIGILGFDLEDPYSQHDFQVSLNAKKVQSLIYELDQELRAISKYGSPLISGERFTDKCSDDICEDDALQNLVDIIRRKLSEMEVE